MTSTAQSLADAYKSDKHYRKWFESWWQADFSIAGRKAALKTNGYVEKHPFAGRTWPHGWAPPHDLDGNSNPAFSTIQAANLNTYTWQHIRNALSGSFLEDDGPGLVAQSANDLSFSYFARSISIAPNPGAVSLVNIFAEGDISIVGDRPHDLDLRDAFVKGSLSVNSSRAVSYDVSRAHILGTLTATGAGISGTADSSHVHGRFHTTGELSAKKLRTSELDLSNSDQHRSAKATLPDLKVDTLNIRGRYTEIVLDDLRASNVAIRPTGSDRISAKGLKARDLTIKGASASLDLSRAKITGTLSLQGLQATSIDLERVQVATVDAAGLKTDVLRMPHIVAHGTCCMDSAKISEQLLAWDSRFEKHASFVRAEVPGIVNFQRCHFGEGLDLRVGSGPSVSGSTQVRDIGEADFSGARFYPDQNDVCVNFNGRRMLEEANFEDTGFYGIPKFYECEFHENVSFRSAQFNITPPTDSLYGTLKALKWRDYVKDLPRAVGMSELRSALTEKSKALLRPLTQRANARNRRLAEYERAYSALRQRFSDVGNSKYERQFHNYELRARRARTDPEVGLFERIFSFSYDCFADYGESIARPLGALALTPVIFAMLYLSISGAGSAWDLFSSLDFAMEQIFRPFFVWQYDADASSVAHSDVSWQSQYLFDSDETNWNAAARAVTIKVLASVQSLLALTLSFLLALAVKRRFQVQ